MSVGQAGDVLAAQLDLLDRLDPTASTSPTATPGS
jgi:hypothetical protein